MNINDFSVYFSGHNIENFARVAIKSFLKFYPELQSRIFYFDDESTDGTLEELRKLNVTRITWDSELKSLYDKYYYDGTIVSRGQSQMLRCEFIFKNLIKHCNTRYAIILDGDTVTLKRGWIEHFLESGNVVDGIYGYMHTPIDFIKDLPPIYEKFKKILNSETPELDKMYNCMCLHHNRFHPYQVMIDKENLVNINSLFDNLLDTDYLHLFSKDVIDVGCDLLLHCIENELPHELSLDYSSIYHWVWVSSSIRDSERTCILSDKQVLERIMKGIVVNPEIKKVLKELNEPPHKLFMDVKTRLRTGNYN